MAKELKESKVTDTQLLDFLDEVVVSTIYLDSGEIIDIRGEAIRPKLMLAMKRPRCGKCKTLLDDEQADGEFCYECGLEESGLEGNGLQ